MGWVAAPTGISFSIWDEHFPELARNDPVESCGEDTAMTSDPTLISESWLKKESEKGGEENMLIRKQRL